MHTSHSTTQSHFPSIFRGVAAVLGRVFPVCLLAACLLFLDAAPVFAQSTYGAILGTVHDASGAVIPGASVTLLNTGTSAQRVATSDGSGNFSFSNIDVGKYSVTITAVGFEKYSLPEIDLTARESHHVDATLQLGAENQTVTVTAAAENVITTEVSNLAVTKTGDELVDLPVAIYSRSTGSTSPISTLTTEVGVQTDDSGNLAVMGTTPALLSVTVDGISSVGVEYSGPVNEMFPSFNSIEEIRVSESNNNAEFSGVADITTVSKAGTNSFHGGVFENNENTVFNAGSPFIAKPTIIMNDFGGTLGGPIKIPHLYDGKDKTFFFISFEGLRLPRQTSITESVPSLAMRSGDLTSYLAGTPICMPSLDTETNGCTTNSATYISNTSAVPVTPIAANLLKYLFPLPNYGPAGSYAENYRVNLATPISANQGDVRLDQIITPRQSVFVRFSYKNRQVVSPPIVDCADFCQTTGDPLLGTFNTPEIDEGMTFAYNFTVTPNIVNEFRGGYNAQHTSTNQSFSTQQLLSETGLLSAVPQVDTDWAQSPDVAITGFNVTGGGNTTRQRGQIVQALDNVTWSKGRHNLKFGVDFKRLTDHDDNVFGNDMSGVYDFLNGASTGVGDPYAAFLLGYPDSTFDSTVTKPTMDGRGYSYAFFGQDDWKIKPRLTLNLGLRYELHPPLKEINYNTAFFQPDYDGPGIGGVTVHGAVVVPNAQALTYTDPNLASAISPTPILTAKQAGLPATLRYAYKEDWGPRIGFAWRVFGNDKTVLRGGWGRFIESPLGFSLVSGWAVSASYVGQFYNGIGSDNVTPLLSFASPFNGAAGSGTGSAGFYYAFPIHYIDPSVQQWNLTWEQDIGHGMGARLSYTGSHGHNLEEFVDLNQIQPNTVGYNTAYLYRPYPLWAVIQSVENIGESNYNSLTAELSKHSGKGLQYDASYVWTRDIADEAGSIPSGFVGAGGNFVTTRFHPGLDYGNVEYDRRHRFLGTALYDLPFGRGQRFLPSGGALNAVVGGWQLGGVAIAQSGPFLTPSESTVDPANTGILYTVLAARPDRVAGQSVYATHRTTTQWLNPNAFNYTELVQANGNGIGRFGNAPVGGFAGPGTLNFSTSLMKNVSFTEHLKLQLGLEASNVFNHRNYEPPAVAVDQSSFGQITALQTAEGAGPRNLELAGKITF